MHEPVEILSPSAQKVLPTFPTLFRTQFLSFFFPPPRLFLPFISLSAAACLPLLSPSPPFTLAARGYWPLSNLIFSHSGDAEKHLRAIKDRRWEVQTMVKKKEKETEMEKVHRKREEGRMRLTAKLTSQRWRTVALPSNDL